MKLSSILFLLAISETASGRDWHIGGEIKHTIWVGDEIPAGFLEFDDDVFHAPSLSLDFDFQPNPHLYFHSTFRADRGFDAGTEPDGDFRFDTLFLQYRPLGDNRLNLQAGKFATVIGNSVYQYGDNPFLLAPLPYSSIVGVPTQNIEQISGQAIEDRANGLTPGIHTNKESWSSIVWGPAYTNGIAAFGTTGKLDYAFEVKNTSSGSNPEEWEFGEGDFRDPFFAGRIGYRPDAAWAFGFSFSHGPFLDADAFDQLNPDFDRGDFDQTLASVDFRWAGGKWEVSGESFFSTYDRDGEDLQAFNYYLQSKYKVAPGVWVAARFGQTLTNDVATPSGGEAPWSPDIQRAELATGWRITPDLVLQAQYTYTRVTNEISAPARNLYSLSTSWKF